MAAEMTSNNWAELERLSRKAAWHEKENHGNKNNFNYLNGCIKLCKQDDVVEMTDKPHGPSYKGACEAIALYWNSIEGHQVYKGTDIFNYSPIGELFMISGWYMDARRAGFKAEDDTWSDEEFNVEMDKVLDNIRPELLNPQK